MREQLDALQRWIGKTQIVDDVVTVTPARSLAATLECERDFSEGDPAPLRIGDALQRTSGVASVEVKEGRSGTFVFVTVRHESHRGAERLLADEHDIDDAPFFVCGRPDDTNGTVSLWAKASDGRLAMDAMATVA